MSTSKEKAAIRKVKKFLHDWDHGDKTVRSRMLTAFVTDHLGKTCPELELEFAQVASLFLARLTAWVRLTYMFGTCLGLQLRGLGVFLSATSNRQYLIEFLEVGGVPTLLEILNYTKTRDEDRTEALRLLQMISNSGRKYKEHVCESFGVRVIAECLARSKAEATQESASMLLESLAHGNPKYQNQVYKGLIALLPCNSPKAQELTLQALCTVQKIVNSPHPGIIEPLLKLLRSFHLEVQYEAVELIKVLKEYDEVKPALLKGLVALLKPERKGQQEYKILEGPKRSSLIASLPDFVQQAAAAKAIRTLCHESAEVSYELLRYRVVHHLLVAMGNRDHAEAQLQASLALKELIQAHPFVEDHIQIAMGNTLFDMFMHNSEDLYKKMDEIQADILLSNKVNISEVLEESQC